LTFLQCFETVAGQWEVTMDCSSLT